VCPENTESYVSEAYPSRYSQGDLDAYSCFGGGVVTTYTQGRFEAVTMKMFWNCPRCNYEGHINVFRVYRDMQVYVICAECDLKFMVVNGERKL